MVAFYDKPPKKPTNHVGVRQMPITEAQNYDLQAPPVAQVVYVTHPRDDRRLISFADYDQRVAEDKLNEALRVFTALGAARIVATASKEESSRFELSLGPKILGLRFAGASDSSLKLEFDVRGTGSAPVDPRPLQYPDEPMFDAVCEGVLRLGHERASLKVMKTSAFGLDGELALRLKKAGFKLGFGGSKALNDVFVIEAAFTPGAAAELDAVVDAARPELTPKTGVRERLRRPRDKPSQPSR